VVLGQELGPGQAAVTRPTDLHHSAFVKEHRRAQIEPVSGRGSRPAHNPVVYSEIPLVPWRIAVRVRVEITSASETNEGLPLMMELFRLA
jgi:hypothetical protein